MKKIILTIVFSMLFPWCCFGQEIALTFDDAPRPDSSLFRGKERIRRLLEGLEKAGVPDVIFFVRTSHINQRNRKQIETIIDAGHYIANHSHSHTSLHRLSAESYIKDIQLAHDKLKDYKNFLLLFRYPFLQEGRNRKARDQVRLFLKNMGYRNGYVTVDSYDWYMDRLLQKAVRKKRKISYKNLKQTYIQVLWDCIQFYDAIARRTIGRSPKHVLLLHENDLAALFISDLVTHLREQGWKLFSAKEAFNDPISTLVPDGLFSGDGRVASIAREKGFSKNQTRHASLNQDFLNQLFSKNEVFQ